MPRRTRSFDQALVEKTTLHNIMPILAGRYPHLTPAQLEKLQDTAVHENAHLIAALAAGKDGYVGPTAYIRIPGKRSKRLGGARGMDGVVDCGGYTLRAEAIVCAAGSIAEVIMESPEWEAAVGYDDFMFSRCMEHILHEFPSTADEQEIATAICDEGLTWIVTHWDLVEKGAVAMLLHIDSNGDLRGGVWGEMIEYLAEKLRHERGKPHTYYTPPRGVMARMQEIASAGLGERPV